MVGAQPDSFPEEGTDAGCSEVDGREGEEPDSSAKAEGTDAVEACAQPETDYQIQWRGARGPGVHPFANPAARVS